MGEGSGIVRGYRWLACACWSVGVDDLGGYAKRADREGGGGGDER